MRQSGACPLPPAVRPATCCMSLTANANSCDSNMVAFARQAYNDSVMTYNTYKQSFPPVAVAALVGHGKDATLLEF